MLYDFTTSRLFNVAFLANLHNKTCVKGCIFIAQNLMQSICNYQTVEGDWVIRILISCFNHRQKFRCSKETCVFYSEITSRPSGEGFKDLVTVVQNLSTYKCDEGDGGSKFVIMEYPRRKFLLAILIYYAMFLLYDPPKRGA